MKRLLFPLALAGLALAALALARRAPGRRPWPAHPPRPAEKLCLFRRPRPLFPHFLRSPPFIPHFQVFPTSSGIFRRKSPNIFPYSLSGILTTPSHCP